MAPRKKSILSVFFAMLMALPIYLIIQLGKDVSTANWEGVQSGLIHYLIGIWSTWIITVSIAVHYKWTEKGNLFFNLNYAFIILAFGFFMAYNAKLLNHIDFSSWTKDKDVLNLIRTAQHSVPLVLATIYTQASTWWFKKKWHRQ